LVAHLGSLKSELIVKWLLVVIGSDY